MIELAILGLLKEHPMHGYQLSRELGESLGGFWRVSYGSLYPSLRRLEKEGAVESVPSDEERGGRRKNVYRVTEKGEKLFFELLQETPHDNSTEDTRFRVRLAFFKYLPPETRIRLLERRRALLEDRLSTIKDSLRATRERVDDYTLALMEHGRNATESDIAWLDGLIQAERHRSDGSTAGGGAKRRAARASQKGARLMSKVRLAIVGVGNCASSLVQGLEYYKDADPDEPVPGLMHVELGGYHIRDIEVVAAFDVDAKKVGIDVGEAIFSEPNNTIRFADVPPTRRRRCSAATPSTASASTTAR